MRKSFASNSLFFHTNLVCADRKSNRQQMQLATTVAIQRQTYRLYNYDTDYLSIEKTVLAFTVRQKLGHNFKEKYFHSTTQTRKDDKQLIKKNSENFIELSLSYGKN